jgi:SAM-dependent methyltransferase
MKRVLKPGGIVLIATPNQYGELLGHLVIGSNPSHVNVHSKSFWINTFRSHGFHYLGNFPEQVFSKARHALAAASKEAIAKLPPGKIGRYLFKFGKPGKWLRDKLAHLTLTNPGAKFMAVAVLFKLDETAKL